MTDEAEEQENDRKAADWRADQRRDITVKLVALAALKDRVAALDKELRAAGVQMFQEGDREMARIPLDGQLAELGAVTRTKKSVRVVVTDEAEFFGAVLDEHPEMIVQHIDPTFRKALLEQVAKQEAACWPSGEEIAGLAVESRPGGLQVRKVADVAEKLRAVDWRDVLALEAPQGASRGPSALEVCPAACQVCADLYEPGVSYSGDICKSCPECNPALIRASGREST